MARAEPSKNRYGYKLKCVIFNKIQDKGISRKYRIYLREAAMLLADRVYLWRAELDTNKKMFSADIYYDFNCFTNYIQRFKTANMSSVPMSKDQSGKRFIYQNYIKACVRYFLSNFDFFTKS